MSAVKCKILLCAGSGLMASQSMKELAEDIENDTDLAEKVIQAAEKYAHRMDNLLSRLTEDGL